MGLSQPSLSLSLSLFLCPTQILQTDCIRVPLSFFVFAPLSFARTRSPSLTVREKDNGGCLSRLSLSLSLFLSLSHTNTTNRLHHCPCLSLSLTLSLSLSVSAVLSRLYSNIKIIRVVVAVVIFIVAIVIVEVKNFIKKSPNFFKMVKHFQTKVYTVPFLSTHISVSLSLSHTHTQLVSLSHTLQTVCNCPFLSLHHLRAEKSGPNAAKIAPN